MKRLILFSFLILSLSASSALLSDKKPNLTHFTTRQKKSPLLLKKYISEKDFNHPELGLLPYNSPSCNDCIELIDKRNAYSRFYIDPASNGKEFIQAQAYSPINYQDSTGRWMEINHRLTRESENVFSALHQPFPVKIDINKKSISIGTADKYIETSLPSLYLRKKNSEEILFEKINLNNISAGDDGIKITNFYPGIDLIIEVKTGQAETRFIINNPLKLDEGSLVLKQPILLSDALHFHSNAEEESDAGGIYINDEKNNVAFVIERGIAYSADRTEPPVDLKSIIRNGNTIEFTLPADWLNKPASVYPLVIDPVITAQNTLPVPAITGTKYSPVCWTNSCDYFLSVLTPANATITDIYHSFEYYATGACFADDGGYSIELLGCLSPAGVPGVFTSPAHFSNAYFTSDTILLPELNACFPAPQCAPQNLNFTLHFYRCNNDTSTNCSGNCIRATQPWIMFVHGRTVEMSSITASTQICDGNSTFLSATPQYGVGPYNFLWMPGGVATDTLTVSPNVTTTYSVTVTDACSNTATAASVVNVITNNNPGFTVTPNPVCENSAVTLQANGIGPAADYDWFVSGSNATGGIVNDNQSPVVSYNLPGVYDIILSYGSCGFKDTISLTVNSVSAIDVSITAQPGLNICTGDTITFHAVPVNGGVSPQYDWLIDGIPVQSGAIDSLVTSSPGNGSLVQVIMHSVAGCTAANTDTANVFVSVSNSLTPQVTISPDTAVCPGSPVTLTANVINGGTTPSFQWYSNGNPIPGANSSTYSFLANSPDTLIDVQVISSLGCVTTPAAIDNTTINLFSNLFAGVALTADPPGSICSGDSIEFTAHPVNGGSSPLFSWYINGALVPGNDSVFVCTPANNDSISVLMTSSLLCATVGSDDDYNIASVSAAVSPVINLNVTPALSLCQGDTASFNASANNAGSNPVFSWTVNGNPAGTNDSIFVLTSPNNNDVIQVVVTSSLTCAPVPSDTDAVTLTVTSSVTPSVSLSVNGANACEGSPVQLIAALNNGGNSPAIQWTVNGISTGLTNDTVVLTGLNTGDTIEVFLTSSITCTSTTGPVSATYLSTLLPRVTPDITIVSNPTDSVCLGQQVELQANTSFGGNSPTINWYINGILTATNTTIINNLTFNQGDVIVANLFSSEQCLTQPTDTSNFIRIFYRSPLQVQLSTNVLACTGIPVVVYAQPSGGDGKPYHLTWSDGSTDTDSIVVIPGNNTAVTVILEDGCTSTPAIDSLEVPVLQTPVADYFYYNPYEGAFLNTIQFINNSQYADSWTWFFPDSNTTSSEQNPIHQFPLPGTYEVKLYTQNNSGCVDSITYIITVGEDLAVFYPNSFTPNGDGANDYFRPVGASVEEYEMQIYNRWGNVIYEGDNRSAWDGRINNSTSLAPEGVYVFRIEFKFQNKQDRVVTGRVTLIR